MTWLPNHWCTGETQHMVEMIYLHEHTECWGDEYTHEMDYNNPDHREQVEGWISLSQEVLTEPDFRQTAPWDHAAIAIWQNWLATGGNNIIDKLEAYDATNAQ